MEPRRGVHGRDAPAGAQVNDLPALIRPDGSVVVPPAVAGAVLRAVVRDLADRVRADGGEISTEARRILYALRDADRQPPSTSGTETVPASPVTMKPLTATEAAELLECSTVWVRNLCRTGRLTARRTASVWLIDPVSLDHYRRDRAWQTSPQNLRPSAG